MTGSEFPWDDQSPRRPGGPDGPKGGDFGAAQPLGFRPADPEPIFEAELVGPAGVPGYRPPAARRTPRPRRKRLPLILFLLTCVSTFWVGATRWMPLDVVVAELGRQVRSPSVFAGLDTIELMPLRQTLVSHWDDGLIYMFCVLAILLTHEMGHFIATVLHRIRASLPYFLPFPINPIGTFGAVIMMDAMKADRRQMFDIGIAGPLAGLIVAIPITWYGVTHIDFTAHQGGGVMLGNPLAVSLLLDHYQPKGYHPGDKVWLTQLNPFFMAGWVGLLVTGLNMLPVSQLDGGHVSYTLFGRKAHWIARAFIVGAIAYLVYTGNQTMVLMIILILLIGVDHPPTSNDNLRLGWFRVALGIVSLAIPVLCFPPEPFAVAGM